MVLTARPKLWAGETPPYLPEKAETLLFMLTMGVILGGRLGFVLFYNWDYYSQNPAEILKTWHLLLAEQSSNPFDGRFHRGGCPLWSAFWADREFHQR